MKGLIYYIKGHAGSERQAEEATESFRRRGWVTELVEGVTPDTIDEDEFPYPDLKGGRLESFRTSEPQKYLIKKSCIFNNLRHYKRVIKENKPLAFIEHDAICCGPPIIQYAMVPEYLCLTWEHALDQPVFAGRQDIRNYKHQDHLGYNPFPKDFPLVYYKDSIYRGAAMSPGTCAYIVSVKGAKKLLKAAMDNGLEQSDFHINSKNIEMGYVFPSPVKYNTNLNTSHNL